MCRVELKVLPAGNAEPLSGAFLMCRVELKVVSVKKDQTVKAKFLMCRVELKGEDLISVLTQMGEVPNVPCGVERVQTQDGQTREVLVPNVPCGVERNVLKGAGFVILKFLMCRVELKAAP